MGHAPGHCYELPGQGARVAGDRQANHLCRGARNARAEPAPRGSPGKMRDDFANMARAYSHEAAADGWRYCQRGSHSVHRGVTGRSARVKPPLPYPHRKEATRGADRPLLDWARDVSGGRLASDRRRKKRAPASAWRPSGPERLVANASALARLRSGRCRIVMLDFTGVPLNDK